MSWFKKYVTNLKQYIQYDNIQYDNNNNNNNQNNINNNKKNFEKTELLDIICGVPQESVLGPLSFCTLLNE